MNMETAMSARAKRRRGTTPCLAISSVPIDRQIRLALPMPELMALVDRALAVSQTSRSAFGSSLGDARLLSRIAAGRRPRRLVCCRMQDHAEALIEEARQRAFTLLLDQFGAEGRAALEAAIEDLIARLDRYDGDTDLEETRTEDDFVAHAYEGPGCPLSDPGGGNVEDEGEAAAYAEWHTLTGGQRRAGRLNGRLHDAFYGAVDGHLAEDAEDDDPREPSAWVERDGGDQNCLRGFTLRRHGELEDSEDDDSDRCSAGEDHIIDGPMSQREWYDREKPGSCIGDHDDAEENGDVELNGDEGDYTPGAPWE